MSSHPRSQDRITPTHPREHRPGHRDALARPIIDLPTVWNGELTPIHIRRSVRSPSSTSNRSSPISFATADERGSRYRSVRASGDPRPRPTIRRRSTSPCQDHIESARDRDARRSRRPRPGHRRKQYFHSTLMSTASPLRPRSSFMRKRSSCDTRRPVGGRLQRPRRRRAPADVFEIERAGREKVTTTTNVQRASPRPSGRRRFLGGGRIALSTFCRSIGCRSLHDHKVELVAPYSIVGQASPNFPRSSSCTLRHASRSAITVGPIICTRAVHSVFVGPAPCRHRRRTSLLCEGSPNRLEIDLLPRQPEGFARSPATRCTSCRSTAQRHRALLRNFRNLPRTTVDALAEVDGNRTRRMGIAHPNRFEGGGAHQVPRHLPVVRVRH